MGLLGRFPNALRWRLEKMFPSRADNFLRIYPTLRCNLHCSYCSNFRSDGSAPCKFRELSPDDWLEIVRKCGRSVIISGGEPTLFPGIEELLNGIPRELDVHVYTNLTFSPDLLIGKVKRNIYFLGSCHRSHIPFEKIRENADALASVSGFSGHVHAVETDDNHEDIRRLKALFADFPWRFSVAKDQRIQSEKVKHQVRRHVLCRNRIILVGPDGVRYPCMTRMLEGTHQLENLQEQPLNEEFPQLECDNWGCCSYCDGQICSDTVFL